MNNLVREFSKLGSASTFLSLSQYKNEYNEVANYSIVFNINYITALQRSIDFLSNLELTSDLEKQVKEELLISLNNSLTKNKDISDEPLKDGYQYFFDDNGVPIKGIKLHLDNNILYLYGLIVHKRVIIPGQYPIKNKKIVTVCKDKLRSMTPVGKFRQFRILPEQVQHIAVQNMVLYPI